MVVRWTRGFSLKPSHLMLVLLFNDMVGVCNNEGLVNVALSVRVTSIIFMPSHAIPCEMWALII